MIKDDLKAAFDEIAPAINARNEKLVLPTVTGAGSKKLVLKFVRAVIDTIPLRKFISLAKELYSSLP